jgi:hypothetical protein
MKKLLHPIKDGKKICSQCGVEKPVDQFHRSGSSSQGLKPYCKGCHTMRWHARRASLAGKPDPTAAKRFWPKVQKTNGCWIWTGSKKEDGYGFFCYQGRTTRAHRVALILSGVDVPEYDGGSGKGIVVDHICKNVSCVRPSHLRLVEQKENTTTLARGGIFKHNREKKNCRHGHALSGHNLAIHPHKGKPVRGCLTCNPGLWSWSVEPRAKPPRARNSWRGPFKGESA